MASNRHTSPINPAYYELGSPDPLGDSYSLEETAGPVTRRRSAASSTTQNATATRERRKSHELDISPSKMIAEQSLSPWRIKVTVEAEPEDQHSPVDTADSGRTQTITKTVKIPLRDAGSPTRASSPKRKSTTRRSASPARTRSRRQSVTNLDIVVLGDDADEDEWTTKTESPRRRRRNSRSASPKKSKSSSRKSGSGAFDIRADEAIPSAEPQVGKEANLDSSPELQEMDLNQVHARVRTSSVKDGDAQRHFLSGKEKRTTSNTSVLSYPTPSPTVSEHAHSDDKSQDEFQDQHQAGLETFVESEGFTMIDLDSIPSVRQLRGSSQYPSIPEVPTQPTILVEEEPQIVDDTTNEANNATREGSSIAAPHSDTGLSSELPSSPPDVSASKSSKVYSIGHLKLPSSTNVQRHRLVTPIPTNENLYSSPKLPSPPGAPHSTTKERSSVQSDQVELAGKALRNSLIQDSHSRQHDQSANRGETPLFDAFSSSTRRQLSAELKFGEKLGHKLAHKQQPRMPNPKQRYFVPLNDVTPDQVQVWRGETSVQHTPPAVNTGKKGRVEDAYQSNQARLEKERQGERITVMREAERAHTVVIEDDEDNQSVEADLDDNETTMGDIWLAEARQPSSSPKEQALGAHQSDRPGRNLIPSPWKRGQHIDASHVSVDESFSGLFWKQSNPSSSSDGFGEAVVENPERIARKLPGSRRRQSGMYDADKMTITPIKPSQRYSGADHHDDNSDDQDVEDDNFDDVRNNVRWRSATNVIDEETEELEAEQGCDDTGLGPCVSNLEEAPKQDLNPSAHEQSSKEWHGHLQDHDSTYSSIAEESPELYRQRTSLSPSKQRPSTPRSAFKGTRASFGAALNNYDDSEGERRRVVWAKRSNCVNEKWEESTGSVRSCHTEDDSETSILAKKQGLQLEAAFEVNPQPPTEKQPASKGWFGWFQSAPNAAPERPDASKAGSQSRHVHSLDGSTENSVDDDFNDESQEIFVPTSRHVAVEFDVKNTGSQNVSRHDSGKLSSGTSTFSHISAPQAQPANLSYKPQSSIPSYLIPPSYPTDRARPSHIPLSTSGPFTNTHFRTLHILHRKSQRPRFHGPDFPAEIRPSILALSGHSSDDGKQWKLVVNESATMGEEDGLFEFRCGAVEAQVLERFMREVEHGYGAKDVKWGWTAEDLAEKLGRVAIGEVVREEENASQEILKSAKKVRG